MTDLIRKSVEQMRTDSIKKAEERIAQEKRSKLYHQEQTRMHNEANAFAMHIQKVKNNEDKIVKSVLNVKQAEDEYQQMLSVNGISDSEELKARMRKILGDNEVSAYHIRLITQYAEYLLHAHKHAHSKTTRHSKVTVF